MFRLILICALLMAISSGCATTPKPTDRSTGEDAPRMKIPVDGARDLIRGPSDALVTVVLFGDHECAACAQMAQSIREVATRRPNVVREVFKFIPLPDHDLGVPAGLASACMALKGDWALHDDFMKLNGKLSQQKFDVLLERHVTDVDALSACAMAAETGELVQGYIQDALAANVQGAPTTFINGKPVTGALDADALESLIDQEEDRAREVVAEGIAPGDVYAHLMEAAEEAWFLGDRAHNFTMDADHTLGSDEAPIRLAVFSDFECPYCSRAAVGLHEVFKRFQGQVSLTFKHFPLGFHQEARPIARVSICAAEQGLFWPLHDRIFEAGRGVNSADALAMAVDLGADEVRLQACLLDDKIDERINRDRNEAVQAALQGTPTVFINGREFTHPMGPNPEALISVIQRLIDKL